jgi:hypothetical protein
MRFVLYLVNIHVIDSIISMLFGCLNCTRNDAKRGGGKNFFAAPARPEPVRRETRWLFLIVRPKGEIIGKGNRQDGELCKRLEGVVF